MSIQLTISRNITLLSLLGALCGCAANNAAFVGDREAGQVSPVPALRDIRVTGEGDNAQVIISADRPVAYTFYTVANPPKGVVDIAQVQPGAYTKPVEINSGNIKRIETARFGEGDAAMTRVEVFLSRDVEMTATTDSKDKGTMRLAFVPEPVSTPAKDSGAEAPVQEPVAAQNSQPEQSPVTSAPAEPAPAKAADAITAITPRKDFLEIQTSGEVTDFKTFRLTKPERLVLDVFGVRADMAQKVVPINSMGIGTVRVGAYPEKVRLVLDAAGDRLPEFSVRKTAAGLVVAPPAVSEAVPEPRKVEQAPAVVPVTAPKAEQKQAITSVAPEVESIEFNVVDNMSRVVIATSAPCDVDKPVKSADGVTINLRNCTLPKKWQRHLDTSAFAGVVRMVTPYQVKTNGRNDVKVQVKLSKQAPYELRREAGVVYLDIKNPVELDAPRIADELASSGDDGHPVPAAAKPLVASPESQGRKAYTGRRVTLEFSDADIRKIFQLIAEVSNLNFIVGDDVTGTITLKLVNVPWDQALDVILDNKGLGMQRDGNIVQIRPKSKVQTLADEEQSLKKAKERAMELQTEVFEVNYASVGDVVTQFNAVKSDRGMISQDTRTNSVIVKDIAPNLEDMRILLKNLDAPEKQVMIEARIVEVETSISSELGIQWGIHARDANILGITNVDTGFGGILTGVASTAANTTFGPGLATGITFGKILGGSNQSLDLKLSALATRGNARIISTPKVVTLNNKAAKISQGQMIPYQNTSSTEGAKTEFVEAALTLEVTPHITSAGSVIMKIKATNDTAGTPIGQSDTPPINKKEATTELVVNNGETTVIGGIYIDSDQDSDTGVPFLKDIPLIGHLFKSSVKKKVKTELLIFITPKILAT